MVNGFSSINPKLARGPQVSAGTYTKLYRRGGSSKSRRPTPSPTVSINDGKVFINGQGFSVAPELQADFIRSRTGGVGTSAQEAIRIAQEQAEKIRNAEIKRISDEVKRRELEVKRLLANQKELKTQEQINQANKKINDYNRLANVLISNVNRYNRSDDRLLKERVASGKLQGFSGTGLSSQEIAKRNFLIKIGNVKEISSAINRINTVDPLVTSYFVDRGATQTEKQNLIDFIRSNRFAPVNLTSSKINKAQSLLNTMNQEIKKIRATKKTRFSKNPKASKAFNKFIDFVNLNFAAPNWTARQTKLFALALTTRLLGGIVIGGQALKGEGPIVNTARKWEEDIERTKAILNNAANKRELKRLRELDIKKRNNQITRAERVERERLLRKTSENYRLGGELIMKTIGTTLINMGVGTSQLIQSLWNNPLETITTLPPAILLGLKKDFNRIMSGDPLEIGTLGIEYWTYSKAASLLPIRYLRKATKYTFRVPLAVANKLSPRYFSKIVRRLKVPSISKAVVTSARKVKLDKVMKNVAKKAKVSKQYEDFIKSVSRGSSKASRKIDQVVKLAKRLEKKNRQMIKSSQIAKEKAIQKFKLSEEFVKANKLAKKIRIKASRGVINLRPSGAKNYRQAIDFLDDFISAFAEEKARQAVITYIKSGGILTKSQAKKFIKSFKDFANKQLKNDPSYKQLVELDSLTRNLSIKAIRQKNFSPAKILAIRSLNRIKNLKFIKSTKEILKRISRGIREPIKKVRRTVKSQQEAAIKKFKSAEEFNKQMSRAKKIRKQIGKGKTTQIIGNSDYFKAIDAIYTFADELAFIRAKQIINILKNSKKKLPRGWDQKVIELARKEARDNLEAFTAFKSLQRSARFNEPFAIKMIKQGKINTARNYFKTLKSNISKSKIGKNINNLLRKVRDTKRKISPSKIKFKLKKAAIQRQRIKEFKQTIRYRMDKNRPIKTVTTDKLRRINSVKIASNLVDDLFNEMARRRRIDMSSIKFRQLKNIVKNKLKRAINTNNLAEIEKFKNYFKKLVEDLNKKQNQPTIKIIQTPKAKGSRIIKNFAPDTPKGTYKEVRVGNQILLQKVETAKVAPKILSKQSYVVKNVKKVKLNLKPLIKLTATAFAIPIVRAALKFAPGRLIRPRQIPLLARKVSQDFAQDFKTLNDIATALDINISVDIAQRIKELNKPRQKTKQKTRQVPEKKKSIRLKLRSNLNKKKKLSNAVQGYNVKFRKRGRLISLTKEPLSLSDAKDFLAYHVDNELFKTAFISPIGQVRSTSTLPIKYSNYYNKNRDKLRSFKIRKGKKKELRLGYIEKRKYFQDTPGEKEQLRRSKRRISPSQRKILIERLKKARAVKMRKKRR